MTELKCQNCRESFIALRERDARLELAKFCPYCGSTSISLVVKELGPVGLSSKAAPGPDWNPGLLLNPPLPAKETTDDLTRDEKPRRSRKQA